MIEIAADRVLVRGAQCGARCQRGAIDRLAVIEGSDSIDAWKNAHCIGRHLDGVASCERAIGGITPDRWCMS